MKHYTIISILQVNRQNEKQHIVNHLEASDRKLKFLVPVLEHLDLLQSICLMHILNSLLWSIWGWEHSLQKKSTEEGIMVFYKWLVWKLGAMTAAGSFSNCVQGRWLPFLVFTRVVDWAHLAVEHPPRCLLTPGRTGRESSRVKDRETAQ